MDNLAYRFRDLSSDISEKISISEDFISGQINLRKQNSAKIITVTVTA